MYVLYTAHQTLCIKAINFERQSLIVSNILWRFLKLIWCQICFNNHRLKKNYNCYHEKLLFKLWFFSVLFHCFGCHRLYGEKLIQCVLLIFSSKHLYFIFCVVATCVTTIDAKIIIIIMDICNIFVEEMEQLGLGKGKEKQRCCINCTFMNTNPESIFFFIIISI